MAKKKLKKKYQRILKIFLIILILSLFIFYKQNFNHIDYDVLKTITKNEDKYPEILLEMLAKNPHMQDFVLEYPQKKGKVYSDNIGEIKNGEMPLLLQYDQRWGYAYYGDDIIAINGCAPTALSMIIAYLKNDNSITPYVIAKYAEEKGYYIKGRGTSWSLINEGIKVFGVKSTEIPLLKKKIFNYLKNKNPIICSMKEGDFTSTGHYIVLTGLVDDKIKVHDPNSLERSNTLWEYDKIKSQIKNLWVIENI